MQTKYYILHGVTTILQYFTCASSPYNSQVAPQVDKYYKRTEKGWNLRAHHHKNIDHPLTSTEVTAEQKNESKQMIEQTIPAYDS